MGKFRMYSKRKVAIIATVGLIVLATISMAVSTAMGFPEKERPRDEIMRELLAQDLRKTDRRDQLIAEFEKRTKEMPVEQMRAEYAKLNQQLEAEGLGTITFDRGPLTRGAEIEIAGRKIRLPNDAEVGGIIQEGIPIDPSISLDSMLPYIVIFRGQSAIHIHLNTGHVLYGWFAPGEQGAFDFLKTYFPEQVSAIDALQEKQQ